MNFSKSEFLLCIVDSGYLEMDENLPPSVIESYQLLVDESYNYYGGGKLNDHLVMDETNHLVVVLESYHHLMDETSCSELNLKSCSG